MRKTGIAGLVLVGILLGALALISHASAPSVAGVAILQFGCSLDANWSAPVPGPVTEPINSSGLCDAFSGSSGGYSGPTPVPAGNLYHLRVNVNGINTLDGSVPKMQVTVYDGNSATPLTCTPTTLPATCNDFAHQYAVKSGDPIWVSVALLDSNTTLTWITATVEETVFR